MVLEIRYDKFFEIKDLFLYNDFNLQFDEDNMKIVQNKYSTKLYIRFNSFLDLIYLYNKGKIDYNIIFKFYENNSNFAKFLNNCYLEMKI